MHKSLLLFWDGPGAMSAQTGGGGGSADEAVLRVGRTVSADFWAGRLEPVWARLSPVMRKGFGDDLGGLATVREKLLVIASGPGELVSERVQEVSGNAVYLRVLRMRPVGGPHLFQEQWAIQDDGTVTGFYVRPPALFL